MLRQQLLLALLICLLYQLDNSESADSAAAGNSAGQSLQHQLSPQQHQPHQQAKPEDVFLAGENNFALVDPPDTEFHVWRAPFPSVGSLWPQPRRQISRRPSSGREHRCRCYGLAGNKDFVFVLANKADLVATGGDSGVGAVHLLEAAFRRYRRVVFQLRAVTSVRAASSSVEDDDDGGGSGRGGSRLAELRVSLRWRRHESPAAAKVGGGKLLYPSLDMDESYTLRVGQTGIHLSASEPWGALRGLETFSQLVWQTADGALYINSTEITDRPRFKHRGLLVDTARHYLSVDTLKSNLDAMEMNKMNVFHWHIVDDQSFPYKSQALPKLSQMGAFDSDSVYSLDDIRDVIEYARLRGIRVIPEFDTPGHTHSWSLGYPEIFTKCYLYNRQWSGYYGPMNPAFNATFDFLAKLYAEIVGVFRDNYIHLGADEVGTSCWDSNPEVSRLKSDFGFSRTDQVIDYYFRRLQNLVTQLGGTERKRGFIVWQEAYDHGVMLKQGTIIQVWKGEPADVASVARSGHRALYSSCWYLDRLEYGPQWTKYYLCDPIAPGAAGAADNQQQQQQQRQQQSWLSNVLGGEACMWNEYQDDNTVLARIWPLASAVAERLWSSESVRDLLAAGRRLEEHRCRMLARGISVGIASGPGSCPRRRSSSAAKAKAKAKLRRQRRPPPLPQPTPSSTSQPQRRDATSRASGLSSSSGIDREDVAAAAVELERDASEEKLHEQQQPHQQHQQQQPRRHRKHRHQPLLLFFALAFAALVLFLLLSRAVFVHRVTRYGGGGSGAAVGGSAEAGAAADSSPLLLPWLRPRRLLICLSCAAACNLAVWLWTAAVE